MDLERMVHNDWWRVPNITPCKGMYKYSGFQAVDCGFLELYYKFQSPGFSILWGTKWHIAVKVMQAHTSLNKQTMRTLPGMWHRSNPFSLKK